MELKDKIMTKSLIMFCGFQSASRTILLLIHCREEFPNHSIPSLDFYSFELLKSHIYLFSDIYFCFSLLQITLMHTYASI